jgi:hypothetical protein
MSNEIIRYENNLNDLSGTFEDIGQLIAYVRDLSKTLIPLSDNLNDAIENLPKKVKDFLEDNQPILFFGAFGIFLLGGYLGTGIVKNILAIKQNTK